MKKERFDQAVQEAYYYLYSLPDRGITRREIQSVSRSEMLGVFDVDYDWHTNLENSKVDYDSFDSLKRHCAYKIRTNQQLHRRLSDWIAKVLEERILPPKREEKSKKTGKEHDHLLASLIMRLSIKYGLKPTRNPEAKLKLSACDAVSCAINKLPHDRRLKPSSFPRLADAFRHAEKVDHFSDLFLS